MSKKQVAVWNSFFTLLLCLLPATALAEGRYQDGDGCVAIGIVSAVLIVFYCLYRVLDRGVRGGKSFLLLLVASIPATALAEGRYADDGGCSVGGFIFLLILVLVIAAIAK